MYSLGREMIWATCVAADVVLTVDASVGAATLAPGEELRSAPAAALSNAWACGSLLATGACCS